MNQANYSVKAVPKQNRILMIVVLGILAGLGPLCTDLYLPALPQMAETLQTTVSFVQLSLTACLLGLATGQIIIGPQSDVVGRRIPLIAALTVFAVTSFLCAVATSIWLLIVLRFIQGFSGAGGIVISRAVARDLYSGSELTKFFSLLMLVNGVVPIMAPVAGGMVLTVTTWKGIFFILSLLGVAILLAVILGLKESLPARNRSKGGLKETILTLRKLLTNRVFMGYVWAQGFALAGMFGYIAGSPFVLQKVYGISAQSFSLCFAVNGVGIMMAAQLTGRLTRIFNESKMLLFGLVLSLAASVILVLMINFQAELFLILLLLFIVISCIGVTTTTSFSLAIQNQAKAAGSAAALLGLIPFLLGALAAPLVGIGGSNTALPMGVVIAVCNMVALLCYWQLVLNNQRN